MSKSLLDMLNEETHSEKIKLYESPIELGMKTGTPIDNNVTTNKSNSGWVEEGGKYKITIKPNTPDLKAGLYCIKNSMTGMYLEKQITTVDGIVKTKDNAMESIIKDLNYFWSKEVKNKYDSYDLIYKRGILLHGVPGTGKTVLINRLIQNLINTKNGICIIIDDLYAFSAYAKHIRSMQPKMPILGIIEDFDSFLSYNNPKLVLNVLDGNLQIENCVYLCTTNYINKIPENMLRPSRIDTIIEIGLPSLESRIAFLKSKLSKEDLKSIDVKHIGEMTDRLTMADLKEFIISVFVFNKDVNQVIEQLKVRSGSSNGLS